MQGQPHSSPVAAMAQSIRSSSPFAARDGTANNSVANFMKMSGQSSREGSRVHVPPSHIKANTGLPIDTYERKGVPQLSTKQQRSFLAQALNDIDEETICPLCLNYFRDPAVLGCGHVFCLQCISSNQIQDKVTFGQMWEKQERKYRCPLCTEVSLGLKTDVEAEPQLAAALAMCRQCQTRPRRVRCAECESELCNECDKELHARGTLFLHKRRPIQILVENAPFHCMSCHKQNRPVTFCSTLYVPICLECHQSAPHFGHDHIAIADALDLYKKRMEDAMKNVEAEVRVSESSIEWENEWRETNGILYNQVVEEIREYAEQLHDMIDARVRGVYEELEHLARKRVKDLEDGLKPTKTAMTNVRMTVASTRKQIARRPAESLFFLLHPLEDVLNKAIKSLEVSRQAAPEIPVETFPRLVRPAGLEACLDRISLSTTSGLDVFADRGTSSLQRSTGAGPTFPGGRTSPFSKPPPGPPTDHRVGSPAPFDNTGKVGSVAQQQDAHAVGIQGQSMPPSENVHNIGLGSQPGHGTHIDTLQANLNRLDAEIHQQRMASESGRRGPESTLHGNDSRLEPAHSAGIQQAIRNNTERELLNVARASAERAMSPSVSQDQAVMEVVAVASDIVERVRMEHYAKMEQDVAARRRKEREVEDLIVKRDKEEAKKKLSESRFNESRYKDSKDPKRLHCKTCYVELSWGILHLDAGVSHPSGFKGFAAHDLHNVYRDQDCCDKCSTLRCSNGHSIGRWSQNAALSYLPGLLYLDPYAVADAWRS